MYQAMDNGGPGGPGGHGAVNGIKHKDPQRYERLLWAVPVLLLWNIVITALLISLMVRTQGVENNVQQNTEAISVQAANLTQVWPILTQLNQTLTEVSTEVKSVQNEIAGVATNLTLLSSQESALVAQVVIIGTELTALTNRFNPIGASYPGLTQQVNTLVYQMSVIVPEVSALIATEIKVTQCTWNAGGVVNWAYHVWTAADCIGGVLPPAAIAFVMGNMFTQPLGYVYDHNCVANGGTATVGVFVPPSVGTQAAQVTCLYGW